MKRILIILAYLLAYISPDCFAKSNPGDVHPQDVFKILYVNAPGHAIQINGSTRRVKENFRATERISWENAGDYIRAENLRTHLDYRVSGRQYKRLGVVNLADYIHKRYTGTKGSLDGAFASEGASLSAYPWEFIDGEVEIDVSLPIDDNNFYVLRTIPHDKVIIPLIDTEKSRIYITQQMLSDVGIPADDLDNYSFCVQYIHDNTSVTLTNTLSIEYLSTTEYTQP